jgi:hypothetical protein
MLQAVGQVFFGSGHQAHDPRLARAIFNSAVVGLVFEEKAAVSHAEILQKEKIGRNFPLGGQSPRFIPN